MRVKPITVNYLDTDFSEMIVSIGVMLSGDAHFSSAIRLCDRNAVETPYHSVSEPLLFIDGHIQLDIPVKVDGVTIQASPCSIFVIRQLINLWIRAIRRALSLLQEVFSV